MLKYLNPCNPTFLPTPICPYTLHTDHKKRVKIIVLICYTAIPRDMLPRDMLTPQIRHYELRQKNSSYANFSDLSTPSYAIFDFFQKNSRYANFSDLSTPSYAIFD